MQKYRVVHINKYSFQEPVSKCSLKARLQPANSDKQTVEFSQLVTRPLASKQSQSIDEMGNQVSHIELVTKFQTVELTAIHTVTTKTLPSIDLKASFPWEQVRSAVANDLELSLYLRQSNYTAFDDAIKSYASLSFVPGRPILDATFDLMQRIYQDFQFDVHASSVETTALQAFEQKSGVCQDFTHIAIACLHSQKLAARYVSGYVDTKSKSSYPHRIAADVSHAWFSVYLPWIESWC